MTEHSPSKSSLRQKHSQQRMQLSPDLQKEASGKVCNFFLTHISISADAVVAGYWPVRGELDDLPILYALLPRGYSCALPHVVAEGMPLLFRPWHEGSAMTAGKYDIPEPVSDQVLTPDIILVPMAVFDKTGHRIGYGSGFYDRTIARLREVKPVIAVGIAYDIQECDVIPAEDNDIRMDIIITDKNVYRFGKMKQ